MAGESFSSNNTSWTGLDGFGRVWTGLDGFGRVDILTRPELNIQGQKILRGVILYVITMSKILYVYNSNVGRVGRVGRVIVNSVGKKTTTKK